MSSNKLLFNIGDKVMLKPKYVGTSGLRGGVMYEVIKVKERTNHWSIRVIGKEHKTRAVVPHGYGTYDYYLMKATECALCRHSCKQDKRCSFFEEMSL